MRKETHPLDTAALRELAEACTCTHIRKAARVITQFYETFLQPSGLRMTQFIVLVVITLSEQETVMQLAQKLAMDRSALDTIESLHPRAVIAGHKRPGNDDDPRIIEETRQYIRAFNRVAETTTTARELYDQMLSLYPDRVNPGALWSSARAVKP